MVKARKAIVSIVVLIPVLALLFGLNNLTENWRLHQILKVVSSIESEMNKFNADMKSSFSAGNKCLQEGSDSTKVYCSDKLDSWVTSYLSPRARKLNDALVVGDFALDRVSTFPLSGDYKLAKIKYHNHLRAWIRMTNDVANSRTYAEFYRNSTKTNTVTSSFKIAKIVFESAIPNPSYFGNRQKIQEIFAE